MNNNDLDNYITGHYGEDQFENCDCNDCTCCGCKYLFTGKCMNCNLSDIGVCGEECTCLVDEK
jgi:hypothetical protein